MFFSWNGVWASAVYALEVDGDVALIDSGMLGSETQITGVAIAAKLLGAKLMVLWYRLVSVIARRRADDTNARCGAKAAPDAGGLRVELMDFAVLLAFNAILSVLSVMVLACRRCSISPPLAMDETSVSGCGLVSLRSMQQ